MRTVLSIDGGGIKGVFPASFLATVEETIGAPVAEYFDLIVGTSTGGLIALGLGLGLRAAELLEFYERQGPAIFGGNRFARLLGHIAVSKYGTGGLKSALESTFARRRLGESAVRLVIPSCNLETGEVHLWKTAHHPRLERDYRALAVDVALATAAAPSFFRPHRSPAGSPFVDGGVWANNPVGVAAVEAVGVLQWPHDNVRILSLGCTTTPLDVNLGRKLPLGWMYWGPRIVNVFMSAQSSAGLGTAEHLVGKDNIFRVSPSVPHRFALDDISEIPSLRGLGETEARKALPSIRRPFFTERAEVFAPVYNVEAI